MKDYNVCEHCNLYISLDQYVCPNCDQTLVLKATNKIAIWRLGEIRDGLLGYLACNLRTAFGVPVIIQPTFLDERPSERKNWKGVAAETFVNQVHRRHMDRVFVNLGISEYNIVPDAKHNFLFGYAYLGLPAAVVSLHPMSQDSPNSDVLIKRVSDIAIHEIGHTLGLDHHSYDDMIDCVMVGDDEIDSIDTLDVGASAFCKDCMKQISASRKAPR